MWADSAVVIKSVLKVRYLFLILTSILSKEYLLFKKSSTLILVLSVITSCIFYARGYNDSIIITLIFGFSIIIISILLSIIIYVIHHIYKSFSPKFGIIYGYKYNYYVIWYTWKKERKYLTYFKLFNYRE